MKSISHGGSKRAAVSTLVLGMIGGAALAIALLMSFSTKLLDENAKLAGQVAAVEDERNISSEKMGVTKSLQLSDGEGSNIKIQISNNGPTVSAYQYVLLYCLSESCSTNAGAPVINPPSIGNSPVALAPGETREIKVGPVADGMTYRIDVITERGNIVSTENCTADLAKQTCESPSEVAKNQ